MHKLLSKLESAADLHGMNTPQLTELAPAQISGPRVVRVEKPDNLPTPRPRRSYPSGLVFGCGLALEQSGDERRPAGLVRRAETAARVAVEVLVEEQPVPQVRFGLPSGRRR